MSSQIVLLSYVATSELFLRCLYAALLFVPVFVCSFLLGGRRPYLQLTLWSLVLLRAVLPSDFSLPFSVRELLAPVGAQPFSDVAASVKCVVTSLCLDVPLLVPGISNRVSLAVIALAWCCAAMCLLWRFASHRLFYERLIRKAACADDAGLLRAVTKWREKLGVRRQVELRTGDAALPFTLGLRRPKIYLPRSIAGNAGLSDVVIGHEMAHIKRYDDLWVCICGVIGALYFFFPPVRYALKQVALQRERVCDQLVVARGEVDASEYAHHLLAACNDASVRGRSVAGLSARAAVYSSRIAAVAEASSLGIRGVPLALLVLAAGFLFVIPMAPGLPAHNASGGAASDGAASAMTRAFAAPIARYEIGSRHGDIQNAPMLGRRVHNGVDLIAPAGSHITAMADGTVVQLVMRSQARNNGGYGNFVLIRHGEYLAYYTEIAQPQVKEGAIVRRGQLLGKLDGHLHSYHKRPRLHLQVMKDGADIDPLPLLMADARR